MVATREVQYDGEVHLAPSAMDETFRSLYGVELGVNQAYARVCKSFGQAGFLAAYRDTRTLQDFARGRAHPYLYSAAMMGGVMNGLFKDDVTAINARRATKRYALDVEQELWEYTSNVNTDQPAVEGLAVSNRLNAIGQDPIITDLLTTPGDGTVPQLGWQVRLGLTNPSEILDAFEELNAESFPKEAAHNLVSLVDQDSLSDRELLHLIIDTESCLTPICKLMGYDALAMALGSVTDVTRLKRLGQHAALERAQQDLDLIGDRERILDTTTAIHSELFTGISEHKHAVTNASKHNVFFAVSEFLNPVEGIEEADADTRAKTLGALADNYALDPNQEMDVLGTAISVKDAGELAVMFGAVVRQVQASERFKLAPSRSRRTPFHIRGRSSFMKTVMNNQAYPAALRDPKNIHIKRLGREWGYQVAKITTFFNSGNGQGGEVWVPVEIMIRTKRDEERARVDVTAAHILRDEEDSRRQLENAPNTLRDIRKRGKMSGKHFTIGRSLIEGAKVRQMIASRGVEPLDYTNIHVRNT